MRFSAVELQELAAQASSLARRVGARRFVMRPGKLTQLLNQIGDPRRDLDAGQGEDGREVVGDALRLLPLAQAQLEQIELNLITEARRRGLSWADIAQRLSLRSRQAAEQRYLRLMTAHGTQSATRDVSPAREQRKRHKEVLALLGGVESELEHLGRALPPALESDLRSVAEKSAAAVLDADSSGRAVDRRTVRRMDIEYQIAPYLRRVREVAQEGDPVRLLPPLARLLAALRRYDYDLSSLSAELNRDLDVVRDLMDRFPPRLIEFAIKSRE